MFNCILKDWKTCFIKRSISRDYNKKSCLPRVSGPLPDWIIITEVKDKQKQKEIEEKLDKGEASSIALALEIDSATLIIDEIKGRKIAQSFNIDIIGTIGIILLADKKGLIADVTSLILRLVNKGFRLSDKMINKIIETYGRK